MVTPVNRQSLPDGGPAVGVRAETAGAVTANRRATTPKARSLWSQRSRRATMLSLSAPKNGRSLVSSSVGPRIVPPGAAAPSQRPHVRMAVRLAPGPSTSGPGARGLAEPVVAGVCFLQIACHELDRCLNVVHVRHLVDGVEVARRRRDGDRGRPGARALHRPG